MVQPVERRDAATFSISEGEWEGAQARFVAHRVIVKLKVGAEETPATLDSLARGLEESLAGGRMLRAPTRTRRVVLGRA